MIKDITAAITQTVSAGKIIRYIPVISLGYFLAVSYWLSTGVRGFNPYSDTFCDLVRYADSFGRMIFTTSLIIKSMADLIFIRYLMQVYQKPLKSRLIGTWIAAVMLMGALGIFPVDRYFLIHNTFGVTMVLCLFYGMYLFAKNSADRNFIGLTQNLIISQIILAGIFMYPSGSVNAIYELILLLSGAGWMIYFTGKYLPRI